MWNPYNEDICKGCSFKGNISKPTQFNGIDIRYVECLRDNEDAKERFMLTLKNENLLWLRQVGELKHCIFAYENGFPSKALR